MVLQEHDWDVEEALQVLEMFSDTGLEMAPLLIFMLGLVVSLIQNVYFSLSDISSFESESKTTSSKEKTTNDEEMKQNNNKMTNGEEPEGLISCISETEESDSDATEDSDEENDPKNRKSSESSIKLGPVFTWLSTKSETVSSEKEIKTSSSPKPSSTSSETKTVPRFTSESSIAKKQVAERKSKAHSSNEPISSEDELDDEDDVASSEFGDSDEDLDASEGLTETKKEILRFFKDASIDELTLISGCSVKKAQKIVEMRPFDSWDMLVSTVNQGVKSSIECTAFVHVLSPFVKNITSHSANY